MINKDTKLNDRYIIDGQIGEGGGGIVYKAFDTSLQNYVVVKQIKENVSSLLECRTEVDILKQLKHENLPKVIDFFQSENKVYTVSDFIEGISLQKALEQHGHYPQKIVLDWARQLGRALAYLHSQVPPIIHSDIKPANIMLNVRTGGICLIDFNISLSFTRLKSDITWVTGGYSPPEQYQSLEKYRAYLESAGQGATNKALQEKGGTQRNTRTGDSRPTRVFERNTAGELDGMMARGIDERSDVYSFGATVYHLLTGVKPDIDFLGIPPVSMYDIPLSEGFAHIIEKCMEIEPEKRYKDGIGLQEAFEHIYELDGEYRAYKKKYRRKKTVCALLIAGGIICLGGGLSLWRRECVSEYQTLVHEAEQSVQAADFDGAHQMLKKARSIFPVRIEADAAELLRLYKMNAYSDCIEAGTAFLSGNSYKVRTEQDKEALGNFYYLMGNSYCEEEQYNNAAECFEKALTLVTSNSLFYRDYAISLARSGQTEKAGAVLKQAQDKDLDDDSVVFVRGEIRYSEKDYYTAQIELQRVIESTKDAGLRERAVLLLNRMYSQCGPEYLDTAIVLLTKAKEKEGKVPDLNLSEALAKAYLAKAGTLSGKVADECKIAALNLYIELYNSGFRTMRIMENIATLYREAGNYAAAEKTAEHMLDLYPDDYTGYKILAFLELDKQDGLDNQRRNYQKFLNNYQNASERYQKQENHTDQTMTMLEQMYEDLRQGGWF